MPSAFLCYGGHYSTKYPGESTEIMSSEGKRTQARKGGDQMKLIIEGDPKEIAALVLELRERPSRETKIELGEIDMAKVAHKAIHGKAQEI